MVNLKAFRWNIKLSANLLFLKSAIIIYNIPALTSIIFCIFPEIAMELTFPAIMEVIVTPITVLIGIIGNILCIVVLNKKEVQLRKSFSRILIALSIFDITFISSTAVLFSMRYVVSMECVLVTDFRHPKYVLYVDYPNVLCRLNMTQHDTCVL